ncbi:MAG TPA: CPBP family intramembrane glutamic endopeptidase [Gemmatimonadales bacterium]|nr:CPBP family intramembrane glutamic endopeptidase [Gemmatimonadales bacterium]
MAIIVFALLGALLSLLLAFAAALLLHHIPNPAKPAPIDVAIQGGAALLGFGLATWVVGHIALHLDARELRWRTGGVRALNGFGGGLLLGTVAVGTAMLLAVPIGGAGWSPDAGSFAQYLSRVGATLGLLAPAALSEEVIFRGLPLVLLAAAFGRRGAIVAMALLFGLAHAANPGFTGLAFGNIALAGVLLGVAFFAPGGIWTAFGVHLGWNGTLAALDAPVSGLPFSIPMLDYHSGSPAWLTGGGFGPEGGLLATCVLTIAIFVAARWAREKQS